jgi:hypothetical protein
MLLSPASCFIVPAEIHRRIGITKVVCYRPYAKRDDDQKYILLLQQHTPEPALVVIKDFLVRLFNSFMSNK